MAYLQIIGGLVLLVLAGDFLVRGAVSIAKHFGVPILVIGLTIVAFGTSAPELVVAVDAVLVGVPALALGNVVGSNTANILLVIGVPAILAPMSCNAPRLTRNLMIMLAASAVFIGMAHSGQFRWIHGIILLGFLASFLSYAFLRAKSHPNEIDPQEELEGIADIPDSMAFSALLVIAGIIGLGFGADLLVDGAVIVAREWGISEEVIGLTLVAIGTSLPELVTSVVAALRRHCDVAVGNVIGSNLFNLLGVIGVSSLFGSIPVAQSFLEIDLWVMLAASVALLPFCHYQASVGRLMGFLFLLSYIGYMVYLVQSGAVANAMEGILK